MTALSDAANEFEGNPPAFATAFRSGELDADEWLPSRAAPTDAVSAPHRALRRRDWSGTRSSSVTSWVEEQRLPALARSWYTLCTDRRLLPGAGLRRGLPAPGGRSRKSERSCSTSARSPRAEPALPHRDRGGSGRGRPRPLALLPRGAPVPRPGQGPRRVCPCPGRRIRPAASAVPACSALSAWRDVVETVTARPMLLTGGLRVSALGPSLLRGMPAPVLLRRPGRDRRDADDRHAARRSLPRRPRGVPRDPAAAPGQGLLERLSCSRLAGQGELGEDRSSGLVRSRWSKRRDARHALLTRYYEHEIEPGFDAEVLAVERRFRARARRLDRHRLHRPGSDRLPTGGLRLIDYKTSKSAMPLAEAEQDLQLALYALACRRKRCPGTGRDLGEPGEPRCYLYPQAHLLRQADAPCAL